MENISELNIFVDTVTILCYAICIRFVASYSRPSFWKGERQAGCSQTAKSGRVHHETSF